MNDVADRFGTDRASLYYYVASKEELFQEVFQSSVQGVLEDNLREAQRIERLDVTAREKLSLLLQVQLNSYAENYPYVYIYISEDMGKVAFQSTPWAQDMLAKTRAFTSIVRQILENGVEEGEFRSDVPPALMSRGFFGMINWTHRWFNPKTGAYSAEQVARGFSQIFFDGVAPRPGDSPA
ncbi:TetR/AcrR family transcriptional regulator [Citricoccus parietis]|uniref:TetR/AcrR family transcriptional regulator n=1 Tax=Citricoccus parietis TaxID=592307 RepID=A0ABV5G832_9MICC